VDNIMSSKLFTTRQGTILLGVIAALIAAVALFVYLHNYRSSVNGTNAQLQVLVAKQLIQKGTSGDVVGSSGLYEQTSIPKSQIKTGAFTDPSSLTGQVAATDVYPNQQLTATDFVVSTGGVSTGLGRNQRAVVIPLGSPQAVGGQIGPGSHVDVWITSGTTSAELFQDMYVLSVAEGNVTFRANPRQAGLLIFASQNSQIWLVLRPTVGTVSRKPPVIRAGAAGH
jgi:Flp pilus assembly protein CpaB